VAIRVGVDVGGTFTKAVAFDLEGDGIVGEAIVPTSHDHADGVAAGVVEVVARLADQVGADRVELVTHSTTQAVNALLEGDVAKVGLVGMGRAPDLRKARKRTVDAHIDLGDGQTMNKVTDFLDVTGGLDAATAATCVDRLRAGGAEAVAVAEAFAPDDVTNEDMVAQAARDAGLPVTTSADLSGLYGLELRAVTAALNASILPIALRTADTVATGVAAAGITRPVMIMRGDGGATDLDGFRRAPARTLYSGPAASVAGALRSLRLQDAVIVEVGGTSSNVAAIRRGRPALSYVQVASHATALRALDVRVLGVAGGSLLRARRSKVYGVGPRSAHIAGLPYACFLTEDDFAGATTELIAPRPGDPADHLVVRTADGRRVALTNTCAANALGIVEPGDYAAGDRAAALAAFAVAGQTLRLPGGEVARRMLQATADAIGDLVTAVARDHHLERPVMVAVGGGAGGVGRAVAAAMGLTIEVPPHAEVISAVGDALSLVRAERERTFERPGPELTQQLVAEVEAEAVRAGASAASLDIRVEQLAERSAVRVTVTGSVGLSSGALPGRSVAGRDEIVAAAVERGYHGAEGGGNGDGAIEPCGSYWLVTRGGRLAVFDQYADLVVDVRGEALELGPGDDEAASAEATTSMATAPATTATTAATRIDQALDRCTRRIGPVTVAPDAWVVAGARFAQVPDAATAAIREAAGSLTLDGGSATVIIGRE
jgi:N-methylhydantoinase A/oxoprolinase/acetone carboxylase beta subunit